MILLSTSTAFYKNWKLIIIWVPSLILALNSLWVKLVEKMKWFSSSSLHSDWTLYWKKSNVNFMETHYSLNQLWIGKCFGCLPSIPSHVTWVFERSENKIKHATALYIPRKTDSAQTAKFVLFNMSDVIVLNWSIKDLGTWGKMDLCDTKSMRIR